MDNKMIFTTNPHSANIGVFKSDEQEFIVEVLRKAGRSTYSYTINGTDMYRYCAEAYDAWMECAEFLGCNVAVVDKKFLKGFEIYKEEVNIKKEQRRKEREAKMKLDNQDLNDSFPRVFGVD